MWYRVSQLLKQNLMFLRQNIFRYFKYPSQYLGVMYKLEIKKFKILDQFISQKRFVKTHIVFSAGSHKITCFLTVHYF